MKAGTLGSRMRHQEWGLEIIWGKMDGELTKGTQQCRRRLRGNGAGGSSLSEVGRQEKAEGSVAQLAPLGGPGFKTKQTWESQRGGRKETNKQVELQLMFSPNQQSRP